MNVYLTADKVQSGSYNSESDVVREALRLMDQNEERHVIQMQELRNRVDQGLMQAGQNEGADGDELIQRMIEDLDSHETKRKAG